MCRCIRASLFGSFGQLDANAGVVSGTDHVLIDYTRSSNGLNWAQTVTNAVTGVGLTNMTHASGDMTGWGTGTECDSDCSGTIAAQEYLNVTITFEGTDTKFGDTLSLSGGATYKGLASKEGGKVWTIESISVPAMES